MFKTLRQVAEYIKPEMEYGWRQKLVDHLLSRPRHLGQMTPGTVCVFDNNRFGTVITEVSGGSSWVVLIEGTRVVVNRDCTVKGHDFKLVETVDVVKVRPYKIVDGIYVNGAGDLVRVNAGGDCKLHNGLTYVVSSYGEHDDFSLRLEHKVLGVLF